MTWTNGRFLLRLSNVPMHEIIHRWNGNVCKHGSTMFERGDSKLRRSSNAKATVSYTAIVAGSIADVHVCMCVCGCGRVRAGVCVLLLRTKRKTGLHMYDDPQKSTTFERDVLLGVPKANRVGVGRRASNHTSSTCRYHLFNSNLYS